MHLIKQYIFPRERLHKAINGGNKHLTNSCQNGLAAEAMPHHYTGNLHNR